MAILENERVHSHVQDPIWPLFREVEQAASAHPVAQTALMRCLSASWLSRSDLAFVLPVIVAAEAARRGAFEWLVTRMGETPDDTDVAGAFAELLMVRCAEERDLLIVGRAEAQDLPPQQPADLPSFARYFALRCETFCRDSTPAETAAFLMAGQTVSDRLLAALAKGWQTAPERDQPGTQRLLQILEEAANGPGGDQTLRAARQIAIEQALSLYQRLLEDLHQGLRFQRMLDAFDRIQARISLEREAEPPIALYPGVGEIMCEERDDKRGIHFTVERYPCTSETLDPRVVRIPPGKTNNRHKHAHETLFYFISGTGQILVGNTWVPVKPGDAVFAPRWAIHQTRNTGTGELVLLAITDYYLTSNVYVGKYDKI